MDDSLGETDVTVILSNGKRRHAFLIENKINAIAMSNQANRYINRGAKQIKQGLYDSFQVFIVAPRKYLDINSEAKHYPNKISYERIISFLSRMNEKEMQLALLRRAIESRGVYEVEPDEHITEFNDLYISYVQRHFDDLNPYITSGYRGPNATWPGFKTPVKGVKITHKSYNGFVDLRFSGLGNHITKLKNIMSDIIGDDMIVVQTGKTANIRLVTDKVYFDRDFESQKDKIHKALEKVRKLNEMINNISYDNDYRNIKDSILELYKA
jgi:hypothetical protein